MIPCGVLGETEEKRTTDRQRQTRAVTTIDRDTGEGRTEPRGGGWHSALLSLCDAERSSVSTSNS